MKDFIKINLNDVSTFDYDNDFGDVNYFKSKILGNIPYYDSDLYQFFLLGNDVFYIPGLDSIRGLYFHKFDSGSYSKFLYHLTKEKEDPKDMGSLVSSGGISLIEECPEIFVRLNNTFQSVAPLEYDEEMDYSYETLKNMSFSRDLVFISGPLEAVYDINTEEGKEKVIFEIQNVWS